MGIPYYFRVIANRYGDIVRSTFPTEVATLYLDFNGAIHPAAAEVWSVEEKREVADDGDVASLETRILTNIWTYFKGIMAVVQPTERVHLCIDGVAPVAKMLQQRKRRFLSTFARAETTKITGKPVVWDTNAISPGTPFMGQLHASLRARLRRFKTAHPHLRVSMSTSDEPGEGEHKMFADLLVGPGSKSDGAVAIYGLDADLIMLSLLAHRPRLVLLRENTSKPGSKAAKAEAAAKAAAKEADGTGPSPKDFVMLDVDRLRTGVLRDLVEVHGWRLPDTMVADPFHPDACNAIEAYVVACFFLGNDFLPNLTTLHLNKGGLETLMQEAGHVWNERGTWVSADGGVDLSILLRLLERFVPNEDADMRALTEDYLQARCHAHTPLEALEFYPLIHKDPVARAMMEAPVAKWRPIYYKHLFGTRLHDNRVVVASCRAYALGIAWTFAYYTRRPKDPMWHYPFSYAPSVRDLSYFAESEGAALKSAVSAWPALQDRSVSSAVQLLCIFPPGSRDLIPKTYHAVMEDPTYGCSYLFPTTFGMHTYLKTRTWECSPVLPYLNVPDVEKAVRVQAPPLPPALGV